MEPVDQLAVWLVHDDAEAGMTKRAFALARGLVSRWASRSEPAYQSARAALVDFLARNSATEAT